MALEHPEEAIGLHSSSDWVHPRQDNQIPKIEGSVQSKEGSSE